MNGSVLAHDITANSREASARLLFCTRPGRNGLDSTLSLRQASLCCLTSRLQQPVESAKVGRAGRNRTSVPGRVATDNGLGSGLGFGGSSNESYRSQHSETTPSLNENLDLNCTPARESLGPLPLPRWSSTSPVPQCRLRGW